ncbi:MAG: 5'-nucleotidase C-terminal domain-containing protein [Bacteroidales bacterium]|nr:5'-nucleotidase C-terminal domain-containing protein [Bacteroidales bacterium]
MKRIFNILIISLLLISCAANKPSSNNGSKEIVILTVNDMHGHIERMPRLGFVADSLRELYPNLLIFSAGDNRTGNSYNDFYPNHSNYPMIKLMNEIGFDLSAIGNHEFDKGIDGLVDFQKNTNFPTICANADFSKEPKLNIKPYHFIYNQGVKICILGLVETYKNGHPSAIDKNIKNISFTDPQETAKDYLHLADSCDVFILLSHCGERGDFPIAKACPQFDVIIGGHTHHKYIGYEGDNVLCTQAESYLNYANIVKINVVDGKVVSKTAECVSLKNGLPESKKIRKSVDKFYKNKSLTRLLGYTAIPLDNRYRIGCLLADSYRATMKTDIAFHNYGAIRKDSLEGNEIRAVDVYDFCPFDNRLKTIEMNGREIVDFLNRFSTSDRGPTYVSGLNYSIDYVFDKYRNPHFSNAVVTLENGEPVDPEKKYSVALSEYPMEFIEKQGFKATSTGPLVYDASMEYFEKLDTVGYQCLDRIKARNIDTLEVVILSVNDMHGHIEKMPRFAYVVDSLRKIYPDLMLVSAGDNRTGNIYNDKNPTHSNLPMISLMNDLKFTVSELGNHEFDGSINGLEYFVKNTNFPIICANADFSNYPEISGMIKPYYKTIKKVNGVDVSVIFLGMIETSNYGYPSAHRDSIKDVRFVDANQKITDYLSLKDSCDVFVLLDHCGIEVDSILARIYPQFDLIIGGHSHHLLTKQYPSGVLYTQSKRNLDFATLTKIQVCGGEIISKHSQIIDLSEITKVDENIKKKVDDFCNVPEFNRIVGHSKAPLANKEELGAFMTDAQRYIAKTDVAIQNPGGVRFDSMESTDFRYIDILNLDPFNNAIVTMEMTGRQIEEFLNLAATNDYSPCHVSGITYTIEHYVGSDNVDHFVNAKAYLENGQPIDHEKTYSVTMNSYIAIWAKDMGISTRPLGFGTNEAEFKCLKDFPLIDYQGISRFKSTLIEK